MATPCTCTRGRKVCCRRGAQGPAGAVGPPGPPGPPGPGATPSDVAPLETRQVSDAGISPDFSRGDHVHRSATIYWPQLGSPNDNIVSNRNTYITTTTSTEGATNFCSYAPAYAGPGVTGDFASVLGGYECEARGNYDTIGGGYQNVCGVTADPAPANSILGGLFNLILGFFGSSISGGFQNSINNPLDPAYLGGAGYVGGGYGNQVYRSGGVAHGIFARAFMAGQMAFSSGGLEFGGLQSEAQYSKVVPAGRTLGGLANESVILRQKVESGNQLLVQANRAFTIFLEAIATQVGTTDSRSWMIGIRARTDNLGNLTIDSQTIIFTDGSAATGLYALVATAAANELILTFSTGAGNIHAVNVACTTRITEVLSTLSVTRSSAERP